jgi:hypothetical protein
MFSELRCHLILNWEVNNTEISSISFVKRRMLNAQTQELQQDLLISLLELSLNHNVKTQHILLIHQQSCHHLLSGIDLSQDFQRDLNCSATITKLLTLTLSSMTQRFNLLLSKVKLPPKMLVILKPNMSMQISLLLWNTVFHQQLVGDAELIELPCS